MSWHRRDVPAPAARKGEKLQAEIRALEGVIHFQRATRFRQEASCQEVPGNTHEHSRVAPDIEPDRRPPKTPRTLLALPLMLLFHCQTEFRSGPARYARAICVFRSPRSIRQGE